MRKTWARFVALTGIDSAIGWSAAPRLWTALFGPLTILLITTRLNVEEQGYYFTFNSIVALQMVFDLGLASVIQQFVSHERAFLQWQPDGTVGGDELRKRRLATFVRTAAKWYLVAAGAFTIVLLIAGTLIFSTSPSQVTGWQTPWVVIALLAGPTLLLAPALSVVEGCGAVAEAARIRMQQVAAGHVVGWIVLIAGGRLWSPAIADGAVLLVGLLWFFTKWRNFFRDLFATEGTEFSWRNEVWPFQWRTALSWTSNFFLMQTFTPILFLYAGAAEAGRMGMSLAIVTTLLGISMTWLTTKRPAFAMHVARREFEQLDRLFFPTAIRAILAMLLGGLAFISGAALLDAIHHPWRDRLLAPAPLALLTFAVVMTQVFWSQSVYLRAHKQEALVGLRVVSTILIVTLALVLARCCGATGMMSGFFAINTMVALCGVVVFLQKRREWHV